MNTRYFEQHGGYKYAKQFYKEAYRFACEIYGENNIVSAVMHADELNKAVSEELGKPVYHYHLHIVAIPTVRKEILWSKRCKDEALRGTVKEVINQVSHSKKWKNTVPLLDENGQRVTDKYGKPVFRKSYSVLQDKLFEHMTNAGFNGFERGEIGSTAENLSSLDYQIKKDKERLANIQGRIEAEQKRYEPAHEVHKTMAEIEDMGQKTITGKIVVSKDDYQKLTALAKEGITSRKEIDDLRDRVSYYQEKYFSAAAVAELLQEKYDRLKEICQPFLQALEYFQNWPIPLLRKSRSFSALRKSRSAKSGRVKRWSEQNETSTRAKIIGRDKKGKRPCEIARALSYVIVKFFCVATGHLLRLWALLLVGAAPNQRIYDLVIHHLIGVIAVVGKDRDACAVEILQNCGSAGGAAALSIFALAEDMQAVRSGLIDKCCQRVRLRQIGVIGQSHIRQSRQIQIVDCHGEYPRRLAVIVRRRNRRGSLA